MMSVLENTNSGARRCAMLSSEPVSRLSMQMTRFPRRTSSSHRCDPRNPAPPVTRQVAIGTPGYLDERRFCGSARPRGAQILLGDVHEHPRALAVAGRLPERLEPLAGHRARLAARPRAAALLLRLDSLALLGHCRDGSVVAMPAAAFTAKLNEQIANEFAAHQQYVACAVYYDSETLPQLAGFFYRQAIEERDHAMMMVQCLLDTDAEVRIPGVAAPVTGFADVVAPVTLALDQEKRVTAQINELAAVARQANDFTSEQFMQWFIKEQVEEVATMSDLLRVAERSRDVQDIEDYIVREQSAEGEDPTAPRAAGSDL